MGKYGIKYLVRASINSLTVAALEVLEHKHGRQETRIAAAGRV